MNLHEHSYKFFNFQTLTNSQSSKNQHNSTEFITNSINFQHKSTRFNRQFIKKSSEHKIRTVIITRVCRKIATNSTDSRFNNTVRSKIPHQQKKEGAKHEFRELESRTTHASNSASSTVISEWFSNSFDQVRTWIISTRSQSQRQEQEEFVSSSDSKRYEVLSDFSSDLFSVSNSSASSLLVLYSFSL